MANNFTGNFTLELAKVVLEEFETQRVLSKNVNTQRLEGKFNPNTGDATNFRRPTDYVSVRTSNGDISGGVRSDIITGQATGRVQDYITVSVDYDEADEALKMGNVEELLRPAAKRIVTDLELSFGEFMGPNSGLLAGTVGTAVASWADIAEAGAILDATGVPADQDWIYGVNPFTQITLSEIQRSLGSGGTSGALVKSASEKATITEHFAGLKVMSLTTLPSFTTDSEADRAGTITTIDVTYVTAKDTMTQSIVVADFGADLEIRAGETLTFAGVNRLNLNTRKVMLDASGAAVPFTATVNTDVTLSGTGTGTIVVTGPAIFEATGAFNTTDVAAAAAGVITVNGAASTTFQPNLFWHRNAFGIGSVPIKKLHSTDTIGTTEDGLQIRVSKGTEFLKNKQIVRFDLRPAFVVFNPFFAGKGFG